MEDDIVNESKEREDDERAWGRDKRRYIGTDTSDERIMSMFCALLYQSLNKSCTI